MSSVTAVSPSGEGTKKADSQASRGRDNFASFKFPVRQLQIVPAHQARVDEGETFLTLALLEKIAAAETKLRQSQRDK